MLSMWKALRKITGCELFLHLRLVVDGSCDANSHELGIEVIGPVLSVFDALDFDAVVVDSGGGWSWWELVLAPFFGAASFRRGCAVDAVVDPGVDGSQGGLAPGIIECDGRVDGRPVKAAFANRRPYHPYRGVQ